jgi:arylsulfatase A-like enzyme
VNRETSEASPSLEQDVRLSAPSLALFSAWFALLAASLELLARGLQRYAFGDVMRLSRDVIWMAPLGQLMIFGPLAMVLLLVFAIRRTTVPMRLAITVFVFTTFFGVFITPKIVHPLAAALLAAGIAIRAARIAVQHDARVRTMVRRTVPLLVTVLAVAAAVVAGSRYIGKRRALAALPPAAEAAPNVILLIWDTVRAQSLGLYGYDRNTTPNLERIARQGVVFEQAISPTSWTLPSHASMFTGYLPHQLSAGWTTPLDDHRTTLAEVFRDAGYVTGGFSANVLYAEWEHGLSRGFSHYEDYPIKPGQLFLSTSIGNRIVKGRHGWEYGIIPYIIGYRQFMGRRVGASIDAEFLEWLDDRDGRPFFAFLNYFDAHLPYMPPAPFDTLFEPARPRTTVLQRTRDVIAGRKFWGSLSKTDLAAELAAYEGSIAYLDYRLGILFEELERRGALDNTVIILTSDHGEEFLEHGDHEHGGNLYLTQTHVPLVVLYPGRVPAGRRVREAVSLRDVAATIAELSGVRGGNVLPGRSLSRTWNGTGVEANDGEAVLSELVPGLSPDRRLRSMIVGRQHFIRNIDGRMELYDYVADPAEMRDLVELDVSADSLHRWGSAMNELFNCKEPDCCCRLPGALALP